MKLIGTTNTNVSCIWTTIGKSIEFLGQLLGLDTIIYDDHEFKSKAIKPESDKVIFIFEAGTPQHAGYSMKDMKELFPDSVFIALSADAIIYIKELGYDQLDYNYVDILLDVEDEAVNYYTSRTPYLIGEKWLWTTSSWLIGRAKDSISFNVSLGIKRGDFDFICVSIMAGEYRQNLKKYLESKGFKLTNGGGSGHNDNDLTRLFNHYYRSNITLGTTSHNNPKIRGMKGFRDWIGPLIDAPLIYDDYNQVMYSYGVSVPYYDYNDFDSIIELYESLQDPTNRRLLLDKQKAWIINNTIEEQLFKVIKKHGIL